MMEKVETVVQCVIGYVAFMGMLLFLSGVGGGYTDPLVEAMEPKDVTQPVTVSQAGIFPEQTAVLTEAENALTYRIEKAKIYILEKIGQALDKKINESFKVTAVINAQGEEQ